MSHQSEILHSLLFFNSSDTLLRYLPNRTCEESTYWNGMFEKCEYNILVPCIHSNNTISFTDWRVLIQTHTKITSRKIIRNRLSSNISFKKQNGTNRPGYLSHWHLSLLLKCFPIIVTMLTNEYCTRQ